MSSVRNAQRSRILSAAHFVGYRLAQQFMTLDVTHLMVLDSQQITVPELTDSAWEFRFLTPDEVRRFAAQPESDLDPVMAGRLLLGHDFCFAALHHGQLACYCWLALNSIESSHNRGDQARSGTALSFPSNMAFRYKGFAHPRFRGQGIYSQMIARAALAMAAKGVRYTLATTDWTNTRAQRSCYRAGHEYLGLIWRFGWGKLMFTRTPRIAATLGVKSSEKAEVLPRMTSTSYEAIWA